MADNPNTRKDQHHGQSFLPGEVVQTDDDADDGSYDGLHVVVHTDQSGSQAFLPDGNEKIGNESGEKYHIGHLPRYAALQLSQGDMEEALDVERQRHQHSKQEHPLHKGDHIVFGDERTEDAEVEGEGQAIDDHKEDAQRLGLGSAAAQSHRVENQDQNACQAYQNASNFFEGDGLFQDDSGHNHGQDRGAGVGDARVDGGRHSDGFQEAPLGEKQSQHGGYENLPKVVQWHFFLGHEERQEPKQQRGTRRAEAKQVHGCQYVGIGDVFATNDVEPKDAVGTETCEVPRNR